MLLLRRRSRTGWGWQERILDRNSVPEGPFDLWIQAASGGEATLAGELIRTLHNKITTEKHPPLRLLLTSGTREGKEELERALASLESNIHLKCSVCCFPLDAPHLMKRAFRRYRPRLAVLLETELWPGFLSSAKEAKVAVHLVNGRMSERSFPSYRRFHFLLNQLAPSRIWAISKNDADRFQQVMPAAPIQVMSNIKFDIMARTNQPSDTIEDPIYPEQFPGPLVIFGSIHRKEEEQILYVIDKIRKRIPGIVLAVFPKKPDRIGPWLSLLTKNHIPATRRSDLHHFKEASGVIVWDRFGELGSTYSHAVTAFVGGSLAPLGGQNFLEPLRFGLRPIIGPHWNDFSWVGDEFITNNLVRVARDKEQLLESLIADLEHPSSRQQTKEMADFIIQSRTGGTNAICRELLQHLSP